jgi:hypothetical protein
MGTYAPRKIPKADSGTKSSGCPETLRLDLRVRASRMQMRGKGVLRLVETIGRVKWHLTVTD